MLKDQHDPGHNLIIQIITRNVREKLKELGLDVGIGGGLDSGTDAKDSGQVLELQAPDLAVLASSITPYTISTG